MEDLSAAGLSVTEAKTYRTLLSRQQWLPSELAKSVNETRTNVYKILDKLVEYKLAVRLENTKKLRFKAVNPARLLELAREYRLRQERAERSLELQAQDLMADYVKVHEQPGVTYYQGRAEIGKIFEAIAASAEEVVFIHTLAGIDFYSFEVLHDLRMLAVKSGVSRRALTPDNSEATSNYAESDPHMLLQRTWLKPNDYTAPVEWGAFEDKLYVISYGQEAMGMVIENQQIATSFKQLFGLIERGQHLLPNYDQLPKLAGRTGLTRPFSPVEPTTDKRVQ